MNIAILTVALIAVFIYGIIELCKASTDRPLKEDKMGPLEDHEAFWHKDTKTF